jgi:hypothetical protein
VSKQNELNLIDHKVEPDLAVKKVKFNPSPLENINDMQIKTKAFFRKQQLVKKKQDEID